jgi:glyceraldehyde 3-phosphate dehydrogenase
MVKKLSKSEKKIRLAINGFGRIGRAAFKIAISTKTIDIVAINDLTDARTLAHLLQYDSVYGTCENKVSSTKSTIKLAGKSYPIYAIPEPSKLPWKKLKIDVVLECTGRFAKNGLAREHLKAGAGKVIVSAPAKGSGKVPTYMLGVNEKNYRDDRVVSNGSCTTNSVAPVVEVLHNRLGIEKAMLTTIHSYTAGQNLKDGPHKDLRRARAAAHNIIPTTTGAAISTTEALPELNKKFDGMAVRVPTIDVSLSDLTLLLKKRTTVQRVNKLLSDASKMPRYKGVLGVTNKPLVSSDFIGDSRSSIVDLSLTKVVDGNMVKIIAWYDNEWGCASRLVEMAELVA